MANVTLGIDHPVITVRNFDHVRTQFRKLGFSPNPVGYHSWGTTLSLLMFKSNFIEIIAVHDPSKFGTNSVNGFCYGRNVGKFTDRVEGLGLLALHSKNADADHARLVDRGLHSQGRIDFKRNMTKPDGSPDVAVVSLGLFLNEEMPDFSQFICHQHRPELVWIPEWQNHPNGVDSVTRVTYLADNPAKLAPRLVALYGAANVVETPDRVQADSGYGVIRVLSKTGVKDAMGDVQLPDWDAGNMAHGIAITVRSHADAATLQKIWDDSQVQYTQSSQGSFLISPDQCGNVIMEFDCESAGS